MANQREDEYYKMTDMDGFLKSFFKGLKSATESLGLDRMFLTGVTPILLNDITSGDNIKTDIHIFPDFSDLCGFTENEVKKIIHQFVHCLETEPRYQSIAHDKLFPKGKNQWIEDLFQLMKTLYDGYNFSPYHHLRIYSPTLVMYLFKQLKQLYGQLPRTIMDFNLIPALIADDSNILQNFPAVRI